MLIYMAGPHVHRDLCLYICCVQHVLLLFRLGFCWKYPYNKYMFNFIDIYSFIPVSGCVSSGPIALLCPGGYNAVKTALVLSNTVLFLIHHY